MAFVQSWSTLCFIQALKGYGPSLVKPRAWGHVVVTFLSWQRISGVKAAAAAGSSITGFQPTRGLGTRDIEQELCEDLAFVGAGFSHLSQGLLTL